MEVGERSDEMDEGKDRKADEAEEESGVASSGEISSSVGGMRLIKIPSET